MTTDIGDEIARLRRDYLGDPLGVEEVDPDPVAQFRRWFGEAERAGVPDPNAMTLATVDATGRPRARIVLLKGFDARGFVFYTNYDSDKGRQCDDAGVAALVFFWNVLSRQVRVEGTVLRVGRQESERYFAIRPRDSQIGAWASPQSRPVNSRQELEDAYDAADARFPGEVPCPEHWGGYRVVPDRIEFWQGRPARMHDRVDYVRHGALWVRRRLAP